MAKARDDEPKGVQPPKGDESKGSSPPPPPQPQPGQTSQPAGQATAGAGPPGLPVSGAEPPVGDARHSGGTSAAPAAEVPAGGIPTPGRTPPQSPPATTPGGTDRGPGPTPGGTGGRSPRAEQFRPRSDDPRHPRVLVAGTEDEEVTVADVCRDLRDFAAAFRSRDWPRLGHAAADMLHLGLNVLADQHRPTTRIGREDHQALSRDWAEFDNACREFDQCRGEAAAAAPAMMSSGTNMAGAGTAAGIGEPAGVGFSPADLVLWFEVVSRVVNALRDVRTKSGFRPATP